MSKKNEGEYDNDYALNIEEDVVYIYHVESGRNGYSCRGCDNEVVAVKCKPPHRSYFRHYSKAVENNPRKCTFSNESYRHSLAKDELVKTKRIKVPALYKYNPNNPNAPRRLIRKSQIIEAHLVENELCFFEDDESEIKWVKKTIFKEEKPLLINPDVTFFDKKGRPILLIEIIATHGIDEEKLVRINRLAIDTIQIKIPKGSPQDISNALKRTNGTKWIYNNEQENTDYLQLPNKTTEEVPPLDEFERKLLKTRQSFFCRKNDLKKLVQSLEGNLGEEQYRRIEERVRRDLSRVEENTERNRQRLLELQRIKDGNIEQEFKPRRNKIKRDAEDIGRRRAEFERRRAEFRKNKGREEESHRKLGERYTRKIEEIRELQENYRPKCQDEIERVKSQLEGLGRKPEGFRETLSRIREEKRRKKN